MENHIFDTTQESPTTTTHNNKPTKTAHHNTTSHTVHGGQTATHNTLETDPHACLSHVYQYTNTHQAQETANGTGQQEEFGQSGPIHVHDGG